MNETLCDAKFSKFDSMNRLLKCTIDWKAVKQYFTVVPFVFQFYPVCNFGKFINLALSGAKGLLPTNNY